MSAAKTSGVIVHENTARFKRYAKRIAKGTAGTAGGGIAGFLVGALGGAMEGVKAGVGFGLIFGIISACTGGSFFGGLFATMVLCTILGAAFNGVIAQLPAVLLAANGVRHMKSTWCLCQAAHNAWS